VPVNLLNLNQGGKICDLSHDYNVSLAYGWSSYSNAATGSSLAVAKSTSICRTPGTASQQVIFYRGAAEWQPNTAYAVNAVVANFTGIYTCITAGTSGSSGPSGTLNGQNDGSCVWNYTQAAGTQSLFYVFQNGGLGFQGGHCYQASVWVCNPNPTPVTVSLTFRNDGMEFNNTTVFPDQTYQIKTIAAQGGGWQQLIITCQFDFNTFTPPGTYNGTVISANSYGSMRIIMTTGGTLYFADATLIELPPFQDVRSGVQAPIPADLIGNHIYQQQNYPKVNGQNTWMAPNASSAPFSKGYFNLKRVWGAGTTWEQMNTAAGTYAVGVALSDGYVSTGWQNSDFQITGSNVQSGGTNVAAPNPWPYDVLFTFGWVPKWISSNPTSPIYYTYAPSDLAVQATAIDGTTQYNASFYNHVYSVVYRYAGLVKYYELWNEFDAPSHGWNGTPQQMAIMATTGHKAIKAAEAAAIAAGKMTASQASYILAPNVTQGGEAALAALLVQGVGVCFDGFSMHNYYNKTAQPNSPYMCGAVEANASYVYNFRKFLEGYGLGQLPIFVTEGGIFLGVSFTQGITATAQNEAYYVAAGYILFWLMGAVNFNIFAFGGGPNGGTSYDFLMCPTNTPGTLTAGGQALSSLSWWLPGATVTNVFFGSNGTIEVALTLANGTPAHIIWNSTPPWGTGCAYMQNDLVISNGNIYSAGAFGTSGATAPSGTTTSSDGTITWTYVAPAPVYTFGNGFSPTRIYNLSDTTATGTAFSAPTFNVGIAPTMFT
jgi:hypothetical protein